MTDLIIEAAGAALLLAALLLLIRSLSKDAKGSVDASTDGVSIEESGSKAEPQPSTPSPTEPTNAEIELALAESTLERSGSFEQFPSASTSETIDVFIGLDFGTSCSKVVIRSALHDNRALAIPFGRRSDGGLRYLLPTLLYEKQGGALALDNDPHATVRSDLKRDLLSQPKDLRRRALAAGYLALTLRRARIWFIETQHREYGHVRLRWSLNMGIPSAWYDDSELRKAFEVVVHAAWALSLSPTINLELASKALGEVDLESEMEINVIPEIGAEVVGYVNSPEYRPGLHVIVDVGGGTFDVCGFVIHQRDGDNAFELLESRVAKLGAYVLHERRYDAVQETGIVPRVPRMLEDPLQPIPSVSDYVAERSSPLVAAIQEIDRKYKIACTNLISEVLMELRKRRNPNSPAWKSGVPVFYAGGGSGLRLVAESLSDASDRITGACNVGELRRRPLEGIRIHNIPKNLVPRLAVAYGLSFDVDDIGRFRNPSEHKDVPQRQRRGHIPFISKDDV